MVGSIMVVGVLTHSALLQSVWDFESHIDEHAT